jgi:hypothetical protein
MVAKMVAPMVLVLPPEKTNWIPSPSLTKTGDGGATNAEVPVAIAPPTEVLVTAATLLISIAIVIVEVTLVVGARPILITCPLAGTGRGEVVTPPGVPAVDEKPVIVTSENV